MAPREYRGHCASDGLFAGPILRIDAEAAQSRSAGSPTQEADALHDAIALATAEIAALMESSGGAAADILAFQLAMLEDEALRMPALEAIAGGTPAHEAWSAALGAEILGYESSNDEYFRARAEDLRDIRNRVLRHLFGTDQDATGGAAVYFGEDMPPTRFLGIDWSAGGAIALRRGSVTSHVAMLARARGIPMVVGLGAVDPAAGSPAILDGGEALLLLDPDQAANDRLAARSAEQAAQAARDRSFLHQPARLRDGTRIQLTINVAGVEELDGIDPASCDGIGLMRSEFLFRDGAPLPGEDDQYRAYRRFVEWAGGRPVTIRTLDIGGDKPVRGLTPEGEANPFLGLRGVRLTLARRDVFRTQLRALARAAVHGDLKVMIPMVSIAEELAETSALLDACVADLTREGQSCRRPALGIMVEVPAVAVAPDLFRAAAFFSIGSNDLTQYVTATSRDGAAMPGLGQADHPAVLRLIAAVAQYGTAQDIPVSLCGDMASDPAHLAALVVAGLRSLSVAPARLARVKAALAEL
ncbi:MAG: phosphoenolpyruvate--protein phosphotransferase [Hyphomicrobiales bacterium]